MPDLDVLFGHDVVLHQPVCLVLILEHYVQTQGCGSALNKQEHERSLCHGRINTIVK